MANRDAPHDAPRDWQNPWIWTLAALLVGVASFVNFAGPRRIDRGPTEWRLDAGRTGAATGVPGGGSVPEALKGKVR